MRTEEAIEKMKKNVSNWIWFSRICFLLTIPAAFYMDYLWVFTVANGYLLGKAHGYRQAFWTVWRFYWRTMGRNEVPTQDGFYIANLPSKPLEDVPLWVEGGKVWAVKKDAVLGDDGWHKDIIFRGPL